MNSRFVIYALVAAALVGAVAATRSDRGSSEMQPEVPTIAPAPQLQEPPSFVAHSNPRALFEQHIKRAVDGDADSMFIVAEVTEKCAFTGRFDNWDDFAKSIPPIQTGQMSREMEDEFKARFEQLAPDCSVINKQVPWDSHLGTWTADWYRKAAAAGSPAARLRMLWIEPESEDNRQSMATLLNDSFTPSDYRLADLASKFLVKYPPNNDTTRSSTFRYLGCMHDPDCDVVAMRGPEFELLYLPAQIDDIVSAAQRIEHGEHVDFLSATVGE